MTLVTVDCGCYLDGGNGYVFHRRWTSSIVQSLQSGTRSTGSCGGHQRRHRRHHFWRGSEPMMVGRRVCLTLWLWREPRGVALYILVTEVTALMETMIRSEALRLPTGPRLEEARIPGQSVATDRKRCSGGAQGMVRGEDGGSAGP